jgi:Ribbon-helix-helix protein, copG family
MKKTHKPIKPVPAGAIAHLADQGKNISGFFKGQGRMVQPIQRLNVDVTASMLEELDTAAKDLNVSRQAVIKTLVRQALDQHYLAQHYLAQRARRPQSAR